MSHTPYDALKVGEQIETLGRTITETDCVNFTCLAGIKAPIFVDEEFCKKVSPFKTRIVPGLLTMALAVGQLEDVLGAYVIAALSLDQIKFLKPLKPGDTIRTTLYVLGKRDTSKGGRGILSIRVTIRNQHEESCVEFLNTLMMRKGGV